MRTQSHKDTRNLFYALLQVLLYTRHNIFSYNIKHLFSLKLANIVKECDMQTTRKQLHYKLLESWGVDTRHHKLKPSWSVPSASG